MFNCPNRKEPTETAVPKNTLYGGVCREIAWNRDSDKYLRWGKVDKKPIQMLIDTGCDTTMVRSDQLHPSKVDNTRTVPVLCVHGDQVAYPTAEVELCLDGLAKEATVVVTPNLPVPVLLGRDIFDASSSKELPQANLMVQTRAQRRQQEIEENDDMSPAMEPRTYRDDGADPSRTVGELCDQEHAADGGAESESQLSPMHIPPEGFVQQRREEPSVTEDESQELHPAPLCTTKESSVNMVRKEPVSAGEGDEDPLPLQASREEVIRWQQRDPTLTRARGYALPQDSEKGAVEGAYFYYRDGLLYRHWHAPSPRARARCSGL